jgi:hypothetical protein
MEPFPREQPAELTYVHLYSEVLLAELYLVNRRLPRRELPTGAPCYTIPEVEVLHWLGPEVLPAVQLMKEVFGDVTVLKARKPRVVIDEQGRKEGPTREVCKPLELSFIPFGFDPFTC